MFTEKKFNITLSKKKLLLIIIIVLVVLIFLSAIFFTPVVNLRKKIFTRTSNWYAVSLNNGQVYFGQIKSVTPETITLKEAYFLEISQTQQQIYSLIRRSKRDTMMPTDDVLFINRAVVLFWEKLTPDSGVVKGIIKAEEAK